MKEIEIAVQVMDKRESVMEKLNKYNFIGIKHTVDIYFYDEKRKNLQPDENNRLYECFRLRERNNKCYMTYKVDHFEGKTWIYSDEDEVEVSDLKTAYKIIKNLGLKELVEIKYDTYKYLYKDYEIVIEDVKELGLLLEVERLNVPDDIDFEQVKIIKQEIRDFIKTFGVNYQELNDGKPELMLKKNNKL